MPPKKLKSAEMDNEPASDVTDSVDGMNAILSVLQAMQKDLD